MHPVAILATLAVGVSASPLLWSTPATATAPSAVSYGERKATESHKNRNGKSTEHHRAGHVGVHGNYGYSYRFQRGNSNGQRNNKHPTKHPRRNGGTVDGDASSAALALAAPPPCQPISPPPDEAATKERFDKFARAFLVTKNITEAFTYISEGYINHNPAAKNGAASAWGILSPIWGSQSITVLRTTFKGNMGWLNYRAGGLGEVVDRYRWDAGCIAEHWDQGEKYPSS